MSRRNHRDQKARRRAERERRAGQNETLRQFYLADKPQRCVIACGDHPDEPPCAAQATAQIKMRDDDGGESLVDVCDRHGPAVAEELITENRLVSFVAGHSAGFADGTELSMPWPVWIDEFIATHPR